MTETPRHSVSVAGIVFNDDGEILVIKRRDNAQWQPPGGVLELGESIEEGLRREIREETGVEVSVGRVTGVYKNSALDVIAIVLRCTRPVGRAHSSIEAEEVRWMTPGLAMDIMTPVFAKRLSDAIEQQAGAAQRTHNGSEFTG